MNDNDANLVFQQLLRRNRGRLTAIARAYAKEESEDLLQEIFLQIWRSLPSFNGRAAIDTWCFRVALNSAISWSRAKSRSRDRVRIESANVESVHASSDNHNTLMLLERFIGTLSDIDRAILLMYLEDLDGDEMASAIGISVGAIRVRIHRIKQQLKDWKAGDE